jgi:hypothetical protein
MEVCGTRVQLLFNLRFEISDLRFQICHFSGVDAQAHFSGILLTYNFT